MPATSQLPVLRYLLIALVATSLGSFGFIAVGEGLRNIDGPNAVADDYILVLAGIAFTLSCLPLLRNLALEIGRDLHNRFADEIAIMKSMARDQMDRESPPHTDAIINGTGLFSVAVTALVLELAWQQGESLTDCVALGGLCGGSLLGPFAALRLSNRKPSLRFAASWLTAVMHVFWLVMATGFAMNQVSLQRCTPTELAVVVAVAIAVTGISAFSWKQLALFRAARQRLTATITKSQRPSETAR